MLTWFSTLQIFSTLKKFPSKSTTKTLVVLALSKICQYLPLLRMLSSKSLTNLFVFICRYAYRPKNVLSWAKHQSKVYVNPISDMQRSDQGYKVVLVNLQLAMTNPTIGSWDYAVDKHFPTIKDINDGKSYIIIGMFCHEKSAEKCGQVLAIDVNAEKFTTLNQGSDWLSKVRVKEGLPPKKFEKLLNCQVIPFKKVRPLFSSSMSNFF